MAIFDAADFDILRADQTALYPLSEVCIPRGNPECVVLELRHAGESNEGWVTAYKNAAFRSATGDDAQARLAAMLAKHVIVGWRNVADKAGNAIAYTPEAGEELLSHLRRVKRSDILDRIVAFATTAQNFRAAVVDAEELGNG